MIYNGVNWVAKRKRKLKEKIIKAGSLGKYFIVIFTFVAMLDFKRNGC